MQPIDEPVLVYTLSDPIEAELVKNMLESAGIRVFLDGMNQAELPALSTLEIKVNVPPEQAAEAREIMAEHEANLREARGI